MHGNWYEHKIQVTLSLLPYLKMFSYKVVFATVVAAMAMAGVNATDSLKDIKHVILFMQENRAFDHYFGTMAGVRNFDDPNMQMNEKTNKSILYQPVDGSIKPKPPKDVKELAYWYLNQGGDKYKEATQCMVGGSNGWQENHAAWNHGKNDKWALNNTPYSLGYFRREELPVHFALAEEFTVGDAYYESTISASDTNRVVWISGTINSPGSNTNGSQVGGPVVDDHRKAGCEKDVYGNNMSCLPLKWKTVPEYLEEQNITWKVYEDTDNGYHNMLEQFEQYELDIINQGPLAKKGIYRPGLDKFFFDLKNGSLPQVSYFITPIELSEHPPNMPEDGAWIQRKVVQSLMESQYWNSSALIVSYDETGGLAEHVMAPHAPKDTKGEWIKDPYLKSNGLQPVGPGYRVPFYIVSPWTRRGGVWTEHASHDSQILFLEKWAAEHGKNFTVKELNKWRREQMSNLVSAFDFSNRDLSVPQLPKAENASKDKVTGMWNGVTLCMRKYEDLVQPPVPYGNQTELKKGYNVEKGYKKVRGSLTEGHYLTIEANGAALEHGDKLSSGKQTKNHEKSEQRFVIHWLGHQPKDNKFLIAHGKQNETKYLKEDLSFSSKKSDGVKVAIKDHLNGKGYTIEQLNSKKGLSLSKDGKVSWQSGNTTHFDLYSVSY